MDTDELHNRIRELEQWVRDLQSGMYINCVYCGHRYGPKEGTPVSMADVLKEHIEACPQHPMSKLKEENEELRARLDAFEDDIVRIYRNHCSR
jgi:polyhydroxyalkanoate synthesis regulator phasin